MINLLLPVLILILIILILYYYHITIIIIINKTLLLAHSSSSLAHLLTPYLIAGLASSKDSLPHRLLGSVAYHNLIRLIRQPVVIYREGDRGGKLQMLVSVSIVLRFSGLAHL